MQSSTRTWIAALALTAGAATAFGQLPAGTLTNPVDSAGTPRVGPLSVVSFAVPDGAAAASIVNTETLAVAISVQDAMGNVLLPPTGTTATLAGDTTFDTGDGVTDDFTVDLATDGLIGVTFNSLGPANPGAQVIFSLFTTGSGSVATAVPVAMADIAVLDTVRPTITDVIIGSDGTLNIVASEELNNGMGVGNDANQTVVANITANLPASDFEVGTSLAGLTDMTTELATGFEVASMFIGAANNVIAIGDMVAPNGNVVAGTTFVGFNDADNDGIPDVGAADVIEGTNENEIIRDIAGNFISLTPAGVLATAAAAPQITGVTVETAIASGAGALNGAILVDFDQLIDPASLNMAANVAFFDDSLVRLNPDGTVDAGGLTGLTVTAIGGGALDANNDGLLDTDGSVVVLQVTAAGGSDAVQANGTLDSAFGGNPDEDDTLGFNFGLGTMADGPDALIGGETFNNTGAGIVAVTDGIEPNLVATGGGFFIGDANGDAILDQGILVFGEPLGSGSLSTPVVAGTVTRNATTVMPISNISPTDITGDRGAAVNVVEDGTAQDNIPVTVGTELLSIDVNGNGMIDELEVNNGLPFNLSNPLAVDWDDDTFTIAAGTETDGESTPTTDSINAIEITLDNTTPGTTNTIADAAGNFLPAALTISQLAAGGDAAAPVPLFSFFLDGENVVPNPIPGGLGIPGNPGDFLPVELNTAAGPAASFGVAPGAPGDQDFNDTLLLIHSENVALAMPNPFEISHGTPFNTNADIVVQAANPNVVAITDNNGAAGGATGLDVGDTITVGDDAGIVDASGNEADGSRAGTPTLTANDATPPYIPSQLNVNGVAVFDAVPVVDSAGLVTAVDLNFVNAEAGIPAATVLPADFTVNGSAPTAAAPLTGDPSTLRLSIGTPFPAGSPIEVVYNPPALRQITDAAGNALSDVTTSFLAQEIAEPFVDTEFTAIRRLSGIASNGFDGSGNALPVEPGTIVQALIATPVVKSVTFTVGTGLTRNINLAGNSDTLTTAEASLEAIQNFLLGIELDLFLISVDGMYAFTNDAKLPFSGASNDRAEIGRVSITTTSLTSVTLSSTLFRQDGSDVTTGTNVTGSILMEWGILRTGTSSSGGTAAQLIENGYTYGGAAIVATDVITNSTGTYDLHVGAPTLRQTGIGGLLNASGNGGFPLIVIVTTPEGERFVVSTLLNRADNPSLGPIRFNSLQAVGNPESVAGSSNDFNFNLNNVGVVHAFQGWNVLPYERVGGFLNTAETPAPLLVNGVTSSNVFSASTTGTGTIPAANVMDLFIFFIDQNRDGSYTVSDDDGALFGNLTVGPPSADFAAFSLNTTGADVLTCADGRILANSFQSLTGGYGFALFLAQTLVTQDSTLGSSEAVGIFQVGAPLAAPLGVGGTTALDTPSTLGWLLLTVSNGDVASVGGLNIVRPEPSVSDAPVQFIIEFFRTFDEDASTLTTKVTSFPDGGLTGLNDGQAYFFNVNNPTP